MKHCICLEGSRILYIGGSVTSKGLEVRRADMAVFSDETRAAAIKAFVKKNRLHGRRVYLALDSGILFSMINLPNARSKVLQEMAHNELTASIGNGQELIVCSVPFKESADGRQMTVLTFTMFEREFQDQLKVLEAAGLRIRRAYVLSDCIGEMMQLIYPHQKLMIQIEAMEHQLRLLLIDNGRCILARNIRLNVRHFCETAADHLLYDEIAEQVSRMIQFHIGRNKEDEIEKIIFLSGVVTDKEAAVKCLGELLNLPCEYQVFPFHTTGNPDPVLVRHCHHALAVLVKAGGRQRDRVELLAAGRYTRNKQIQSGRNYSGMRFGMLLSANIIILLGISALLYGRNIYYAGTVEILADYVNQQDRQSRYRDVVRDLETLAGIREHEAFLIAGMALVDNQNLLQSKDYEVIWMAMSDDMKLEGLRYDDRDGIYQADIVAASPREVTELIVRIRKEDHFESVSHNYWRQIRGTEGQLHYATTILATVKRGQADAVD